MNRLLKILVALLAVFVICVMKNSCIAAILNPITDIAWHGMFPIKIAGIEVGKTDLPSVPDKASKPVCICMDGAVPRIGIPVSFWEPNRFVETVRDPFYFPSIEQKLPGLKVAGGTRSSRQGGKTPQAFAQAHWFVFAPLVMLDILTDFVCAEHMDFDLGYMTEVDPLWNNDLLSLIITPEALLFANPATQISCTADSIASNAGKTLDPLFWCMGSWGSVYPLSGHINTANPVEANAGIAARMIFKLGRMGMLWDGSLSLCRKIWLPIWIKSHYRFQIARPVRGMQVFPLGRTSMIWGAGKNIPKARHPDSFLFMVFRKRACCVL